MKTTLTTGQSSKRRADGFTLIELILVMVMVCILLATTAPSLRGFFASHQVTDAAAQIVALTRYARAQAAAEGRPYRLNFDAEAGAWWLTAQEGAEYAELGTEFGRVFLLPEGVAFDTSALSEGEEFPTKIDFAAGGATTPVRIRLIGRTGERLEVRCAAPAEPFRVADISEEEL